MKKLVLVVDDDESVRESTKRILERADYQVILAADGQQALDRFSSNQIDLLILDLNLPIRLGWDVFEEMTRQNPCLPISIITGIANQYHIAAAAGVGALLTRAAPSTNGRAKSNFLSIINRRLTSFASKEFLA